MRESEREREKETRSRISEGARVYHHEPPSGRADDGRPCLVTSLGRLDGIHLFVRPLVCPIPGLNLRTRKKTERKPLGERDTSELDLSASILRGNNFVHLASGANPYAKAPFSFRSNAERQLYPERIYHAWKARVVGQMLSLALRKESEFF